MESILGYFLYMSLSFIWSFDLILSSSSSSKENITSDSSRKSSLQNNNYAKVLPLEVQQLSFDEYEKSLRERFISKYTYTDSTISALLDIHNEYRKNVTPTASNMNYVVSVLNLWK